MNLEKNPIINGKVHKSLLPSGSGYFRTVFSRLLTSKSNHVDSQHARQPGIIPPKPANMSVKWRTGTLATATWSENWRRWLWVVYNKLWAMELEKRSTWGTVNSLNDSRMSLFVITFMLKPDGLIHSNRNIVHVAACMATTPTKNQEAVSNGSVRQFGKRYNANSTCKEYLLPLRSARKILTQESSRWYNAGPFRHQQSGTSFHERYRKIDHRFAIRIYHQGGQYHFGLPISKVGNQTVPFSTLKANNEMLYIA